MSLKSSARRGREPWARPAVLSPADAPLAALVILGFGLLRTWSLIGGSPTLFIPAQSMLLAAERSAAFGEDVVYAAVLIVLSIVVLRTNRINRKALMVASTAILCLGVGLFLLAPLLGAQAFPLSIAGRVMFASAACIAVLWGEQLCSVGIRASLLVIAGSYALSYIGTLIFVATPPFVVEAAQLLLPALSAGVWFAVVKRAGACDESTADGPLRGRSRTVPYRVFLGVGIFGAALLLTNGLSEGKTGAPDEFLTLYVGLAVSLCIAGIAAFLPRNVDLTFVFRLMLPIIVACTFLVFAIEADQQPYEVAAIGFGWTFFIIFAWEIWCIAAAKTTVPPLAVFSLGSAILSLCTLAAEGLRALAALFSVDSLFIIASICIVSILTSLFLLNEQKVREVVQDQRTLLDRADEGACRLCVERMAAEIKLTEREKEIAIRVLQGKDNAAISQELFISKATLYTHLRNMYKKAGVHSRQEFSNLMNRYC